VLGLRELRDRVREHPAALHDRARLGIDPRAQPAHAERLRARVGADDPVDPVGARNFHVASA